MGDYYDPYDLLWRENVEWANIHKKHYRAKILERYILYLYWAWKQRAIAHAHRPGPVFKMENTLVTAGERDNTWRPFLDVPADGNQLEWPCEVWVPPWAEDLRLWYIWQSINGSVWDVRWTFGSIQTIHAFSGYSSGVYNVVSTLIEGISAYQNTVQSLSAEYRINGGSMTFLEILNGANPDGPGSKLYIDCQWITEGY